MCRRSKLNTGTAPAAGAQAFGLIRILQADNKQFTLNRKCRQRSRILRLGLAAERSETVGMSAMEGMGVDAGVSGPELALLRASDRSMLVAGAVCMLLCDLLDGEDVAPVRRTCRPRHALDLFA